LHNQQLKLKPVTVKGTGFSLFKLFIFYPVLTGSNLSVSKEKRQVRPFQFNESKEIDEANCP